MVKMFSSFQPFENPIETQTQTQTTRNERNTTIPFPIRPISFDNENQGPKKIWINGQTISRHHNDL